MSAKQSGPGETKGLRGGLANYGDPEFSLFLRKAFIKGAGFTDDALDRTIVGITNTGSDFNPCHGNSRQLIDAIKRGVMHAGGLPVKFPTLSIGESFSTPTSMYLRNLMAMGTEEMIRAQPMDAVVLIGGCDKTVPAQLMASASANVPAVELVTGPMLTGYHKGVRVGACTDCRYYWGQYRGGAIDAEEISEINGKLVASAGTCSVMGTASTMACISEALGIALPGSASAPAVTSDRMRIAEQSGAAAVKAASNAIAPDKILTRNSFENALRVLLAIGGSTNGIIHLTAIARRMGIELDLKTLDQIGRETPVLVDLKPSGTKYMEDLHAAGGLPAVLYVLRDVLHLNELTITGATLGESIDQFVPFEQDVVRPLDNPVYPAAGIACLHGNLAPSGAIIKQSAADPSLMEHEGRAVVFGDVEEMAARIDDPELDVRPQDILVLKNIGPIGGPGMPEAGYLPIPKKLASQGVRDMVRISDGRMSGTAAGTIVLHVAPEAAVGGPLAYVQSGDVIRLSVSERELELKVDDAELKRRRTSRKMSEHPHAERGYRKLFLEQVTQADEGCDFVFLRPPEAGDLLK